MKIGLDFDGVITNLGKLKALVAQELYDIRVPQSKFDREFVLVNKFLTEAEYLALREYAYLEKRALDYTHPVRGAVATIKRLTGDGHEVTVVTARVGKMLANAKEWLKRHELSLPIVGVGFNVSKRGMVRGLDVFIDDYLIQLFQIRDLVPNLFLFSWGYNERFDERGIARRVRSWGALYREIKKLERKHALHKKRG